MKDITIWGLVLGLILMILPLYYLHVLKTGLVRTTLNATFRMFVQLYLIGLYIQYLFEIDLWYVNIAWALIMVCVACVTAIQRIKIKPSVLLMPLITGFLVTGLAVSAYVLALILNIDDIMSVGDATASTSSISIASVFSARYFISIFGLLLGNMLGVSVVALTTYYEGLRRERQMYYYLLGNGATPWEATAPFLSKAIVKAFNPCIANMAVMGIVSMPGTMIGQILGGADPSGAIKYQITIVIITFMASMMSLIITVCLARSKSFDKMGRLRDVFV